MSQAQALRLKMAQVEQPTIVERLVGRLPLPYVPASLLLAALLGPPGYVLVRYLDSGTFAGALTGYFAGMVPAATWQQVAAFILWTAFTFYVFWMIRYVRMQILAAEAQLVALLPEGKATYEKAFAHVSDVQPVLVLAFMLIAVFAGFIATEFRHAGGVFELIYRAGRIPALYLAYATATWVYARSLWGLRQLGQQPLKLKPFYEDGMLDVRPMGSLSLSLSLAYFGFVGLMVLIALTGPVYVQFTAVLVASTVLGAVMFFLPLNGVHKQMAQEKDRQQASIRRRLMQMVETPAPSGSDGEPTLSDLRDVLADLKTIRALEAVEPKVAAIPTWPIDTGMIRRLAAVVTSIAVAIITHAILLLLPLQNR